MQTDEELLRKIAVGDEAAENELFHRYKELVTKISRGYFIVGGDMEDIIQEGMIGLYKAVKSFTPEKECSFKTFAIICIKHQIQTAIKRANAIKNKALSSAVSFQTFTDNVNGVDTLPIELVLETTPVEKAINKENFESLNSKIKECLTKLELKVLKLYLQGYLYREIADELSVPKKTIDNSLSRIKTKLRAKLAQ